jgi:hypothetical protein
MRHFKKISSWLELWCLMSLSTMFQLYRGDQFYWRRKPEYPEKTLAVVYLILLVVLMRHFSLNLDFKKDEQV